MSFLGIWHFPFHVTDSSELDSKDYKAKLLQLKLIHIFARAILLMKKLEIEKTKPTFITFVFWENLRRANLLFGFI